MSVLFSSVTSLSTRLDGRLCQEYPYQKLSKSDSLIKLQLKMSVCRRCRQSTTGPWNRADQTCRLQIFTPVIAH